MDYIDELLALYRERDAATRRFLIARMPSVPLGPETESLVELITAEIAAGEPGVAAQGRRELARLAPRLFRHLAGLERAESGVWTGLAGRAGASGASGGSGRSPDSMIAGSPGEGTRPARTLCPDESGERSALAPAPDPARRARGLAGARHAFAGLLAAAERRLSDPAPLVRQLASLVAGAFPAGEVAGGGVAGPPESLDFARAAALAERGALTGAQLIELVEAAPARADLALFLRRGDDAAPGIARLLERTGSAGHAALAQALAGLSAAARAPLADRLLALDEGWTTAFVLEALIASPSPADFDAVERVFATRRHEFLRVLAVRAAGHIANPATVPFLVERLSDRSPRVAAAALEGLSRREPDAARLAPAASPLLASPLLRARVSAILVIALADPAAAAPAVEALLTAQAAVARLEGAWLLGYLPAMDAADALVDIARGDPAAAVRNQAVRSLARQPARFAVDRLAHLLSAGEPDVQRATARGLVRLAAEAPAAVSDALVAALFAATRPAAKAVLLASYGQAGARAEQPYRPGPLEEHLAHAARSPRPRWRPARRSRRCRPTGSAWCARIWWRGRSARGSRTRWPAPTCASRSRRTWTASGACTGCGCGSPPPTATATTWSAWWGSNERAR